MTNAEKFKEVFWFELTKDLMACEKYDTCCDCQYESWAESEYNEPCCGTCKHHHFECVDRGWVCCNSDSDHVADWTEYDDCCECWEGRE